MNKKIEPKPAIFSKSSKTEQKSINLVNSLLDKVEHTHSQINQNDRTPNSDGYIWILEKTGAPIGKIEVQVKTLKQNYKTPSINVKLKLLAYAKKCQLPFYLFAVDYSNNCFFWTKLDSNKANELIDSSLDKKKQSASIQFDSQNVIPESTPFDQWKTDILEHINLIKEAHEIKDTLTSYKEILEKSNASNEPKDKDPHYHYINIFLDELNSLYNREFKVLKNLFIAEFWKFGVCLFGEFSENKLAYSLFSIQTDENCLPIFKYQTDKSVEEFRNENFNWTFYGGKNPILSNPIGYAYERIQLFMNSFLERKLIWSEDYNLINEYLFYINDTYKIMDEPGSPDEIDTILLEPYKKAIEILNTKLVHEQKIASEFPEYKRSLPRALDYIQKLRLDNRLSIIRTIPSKRSLQKIRTHHYETSKYPQNTIHILESYIYCVEESFEVIVNQFFPLLVKDLLPPKKYNTEIVTLSHLIIPGNGDEKDGFYPIILFIGCNDPDRTTFIRIFEENPDTIKLDLINQNVKYHGKDLNLVKRESKRLNLIFGNDEMPLRWGVYQKLQNGFDNYFSDKKI